MSGLVTPLGCARCNLGQNPQPGTHIVPGRGNPNADIMIVGEAPGHTEAVLGRPFEGDSGTALTELLTLAGINIADVYLTNVCKCWPWTYTKNEKTGGQYLSSKTPTSEEMRSCLLYLKEEIKLVKPKVIIALGAAALEALEGRKFKINDRKGIPSIYKHITSSRIYIMPTLHPLYVKRNGGVHSSIRDSGLTMVAEDVVQHLKYAVQLTNNSVAYQEHKYMIIDNKEKLYHMRDVLKQRKVASFDIETTGLAWDATVLGLGFGVDVGKACYIPFWVKPDGFGDDSFFGTNTASEIDPTAGGGYKYGLVPFWTGKDVSLEEVIAVTKECMEEVDIQKSAHNSKFDMRGLRKDLKIETKGLIWDILCGAYLLDENADHDLETLSKKYIDLLGYYEDFDRETNGGKEAWKAPLEVIAMYCCGDCDATYRETKAQIDIFSKKPAYMSYMENMYIPIMEFTRDFEYIGVRYDVVRAKAMYAEFDTQISTKRNEIINLAGVKFNPDSNDELAKVLFGVLGLKHKKKTKAGAQAVDSDVLEDLAKQHPLAAKISDYRKMTKMQSTYLDRFIKEADSNNRLHLSLNPVGTVTGRPSSQGLMNIPRDGTIKNLFMASEGSILIQADLSQAEVRCFAHYSNEQVLRDAFENEKIDVHAMVAAEIMGVPYEEFFHKYKIEGNQEYSDLRQAAKGTVFGLLYGRGPASIAEEYGMTVEEAVAFMDRFFTRFPKCKEWIDATHKLVEQAGEVVNIFGRVRRIPSIFSSDPEVKARAKRQAVNSIIQSTASDITMFSLGRIHRKLLEEQIPAHIVLTVYDSIIIDTPYAYVPQVKKLLKDTLEAQPHPLFTVKIKADVDEYERWGLKMKQAA